MALISEEKLGDNPVVKSRKEAWGNLANQQYNTPGDVYEANKPVDASAQYQGYQKKIGIIEALKRGLPDEEKNQKFQQAVGILQNKESEPYTPYEPTLGESIAAGITDFVRSGVEVGAELFDPTVKAARESTENLRKIDPEFADLAEQATLGKKLSGEQLAIKGGASVGEAALSFFPFFKAGRVGMVAAEAASLSKLGSVGAKVAANPTLTKLYSTGMQGALYGGFYGLHKYDADWSEAAKGAAMGGVFGAGLVGFGRSLSTAGKYGGSKAMIPITAVGRKVMDGARYVDNKFLQKLPAKVYAGMFSVESTLKKYYGDIGENFAKMFKGASREATADLGAIQMSLIDQGLIQPPPGMKRVLPEGVEFVGENSELMTKYNQILRGKGAYADPLARADAISNDPRLEYLDTLRKTYGATAQREGVVDSLLDLDTYLPKHTPTVELKLDKRRAIQKLATQAEREAAYAETDPLVKEMVENSVFYEKSFKTLDEAYEHYYDYVDIVTEGSHSPIGDNKFLQKMVAEGQAKTLEQAKGMIIDDLKFRKKSLTPLAGSLDFKRKVNLPWYDPNPARVMPQYVYDASMRIEMAKKFGANDEVIHEMIGSIKKDLERGVSAEDAAKTFEEFVRAVTGQVNRSRGVEKASALIRSLQVPKLAFASVINLGQSLNTLLASDLGSVMHGLTSAFKREEMRKTIERGVLTNNFIRQVFDYNTGGAKLADKFMKYTGFTYSEMFNRTVGSVSADWWGNKNLTTLFKKYNLKGLSDDEQKTFAKMFSDKAAMEKESLMGGLKVQKELFDEFRQKFPDEEFTASAGNLGAAEKRLDGLEKSIAEKTEKLQKARDLLEKELLSESEPLTALETEDLRATIEALRGEIKASQGVTIGKEQDPAVLQQFSAEEIQKAKDGVVALKRAKLEDVIARLESKFDEVRADGTMPRDVVTMRGEASQSDESLEHFVTRVQGEIENIDAAIVSLQNELADKTSILETAMDSYKISEERARKSVPGGTDYEKYIAERQKEVAPILEQIKKDNPREYFALQELGVDVDEILSRGFMTPEEKALASQTFVERTQFLGQPLDLPYFASTPVGKVLFQFKTFSYQQARFITREMKTQFARKDYSRAFRNIFILSTVFPMTGEVLADVRSLITQEKRPTKALDRYVADIFAAGTYGMFYDYWRAAESGNTAKTLLGPAPGDVVDYLEALVKTTGDMDAGLKDFSKKLLQQTGVGRPVVNVIYPSQKKGQKSSLESLQDWAADD